MQKTHVQTYDNYPDRIMATDKVIREFKEANPSAVIHYLKVVQDPRNIRASLLIVVYE